VIQISQLFPEVLDGSTLVAMPTQPIYLPIGIEGQMDADGTGTVNTLYQIKSVNDAITTFGAVASLTQLITEIIKRGSSPVIAAASKKASAPLLTDRQPVWDNMASDPSIRIRLTDSIAQADLVALATSCNNAELAQHKQFCIVGMANATTKANLIAGATAIASTRCVLVGPGVYNEAGVLKTGSFAAACAAAMVSMNSDPSNDLDLYTVPYLTGIEKDSLGYPLWREKIVSGALVNDFEDLLQGGVSPLMPSDTPGGVQTSHLRTTYTADGSYDALSTRIIVDQVYVDVRNYINAMGYLHRPNNDDTRSALASGVEALLMQRQDWISPIAQADGSSGYNVTATPSTDQRQVIVAYSGVVIRGIQTIKVSARLTIPT
jgi:hypothetical protein